MARARVALELIEHPEPRMVRQAHKLAEMRADAPSVRQGLLS